MEDGTFIVSKRPRQMEDFRIVEAIQIRFQLVYLVSHYHLLKQQHDRSFSKPLVRWNQSIGVANR